MKLAVPKHPKDVLNWGEPETDSQGNQVFRGCPDAAFWSAWHAHKTLLQEWGICVKPSGKQWEATWSPERPVVARDTDRVAADFVESLRASKFGGREPLLRELCDTLFADAEGTAVLEASPRWNRCWQAARQETAKAPLTFQQPRAKHLALLAFLTKEQLAPKSLSHLDREVFDSCSIPSGIPSLPVLEASRAEAMQLPIGRKPYQAPKSFPVSDFGYVLPLCDGVVKGPDGDECYYSLRAMRSSTLYQHLDPDWTSGAGPLESIANVLKVWNRDMQEIGYVAYKVEGSAYIDEEASEGAPPLRVQPGECYIERIKVFEDFRGNGLSKWMLSLLKFLEPQVDRVTGQSINQTSGKLFKHPEWRGLYSDASESLPEGVAPATTEKFSTPWRKLGLDAYSGNLKVLSCIQRGAEDFVTQAAKDRLLGCIPPELRPADSLLRKDACGRTAIHWLANGNALDENGALAVSPRELEDIVLKPENLKAVDSYGKTPEEIGMRVFAEMRPMEVDEAGDAVMPEMD